MGIRDFYQAEAEGSYRMKDFASGKLQGQEVNLNAMGFKSVVANGLRKDSCVKYKRPHNPDLRLTLEV
ncbi:hypothetical protein BGZ58_010800 [Dissophora ornata]|nr:hypothetical protein BGZ58_010800 [Dissophora ornata]